MYSIFQICHVFNPNDEHRGQARIRELFCHGHGPKPVFENVPFQAAVGLNLAIAAMVIGQEQPLVGDHTRRASASKLNNRILQRTAVDGVNVLSGQLEAHVLHVSLNGLEQGRNPHALRRLGRKGEAQRQCRPCPFAPCAGGGLPNSNPAGKLMPGGQPVMGDRN